MQCNAIVNVVAKICGCHLIKSAQQLRLSLRQTAHRAENTARKYVAVVPVIPVNALPKCFNPKSKKSYFSI